METLGNLRNLSSGLQGFRSEWLRAKRGAGESLDGNRVGQFHWQSGSLTADPAADGAGMDAPGP